MKRYNQSIRQLYTVATLLWAATGPLKATVFTTETKLTAGDAAAGDVFGGAVAISADTAVIGAIGEADGGPSAGAAYVFVRTGATWTQQQKLTASDGNAGDNFGVSAAISGDTIVVGAYADDDAGDGSGSAYVFVRSGTTWTQQQKLTANDAAAGDFFGLSVAISGDTILVGASTDEQVAHNCGSVYVFVRSGATWTQQQELTPADAEAWKLFGSSVAISGDTAIIGATGDAHAGPSTGSAYVFVRSGGTWAQQQKLTASDGASFDIFGGSVGISGDTAIVGAFGDNDGGTRSGSAYIFVRNSGSWSQAQKLTASDAAPEDEFGWSVAIDGGTAIVGARWAQSQSGSAYVFAASGGNWTQQQKLAASDATAGDWFGYSVALNGGTAVVGAVLDADAGSRSGSAYVFEQGNAQDDIRQIAAAVSALQTAGALNAGQANALTVKLHAAIRTLDSNNSTAAANQLQAFINQVRALIRSRQLTLAQGQPLIDAANAVIGEIVL